MVNDSSEKKPPASLVQVLRGHLGIVSSVAFHPTNRIGHFQRGVECGGTKDEAAADDHDDDGNAEERTEISTTRNPCRQMASSSSDGTVMIFNIHERSANGKENDADALGRDHGGKVRAYRFIGHRGPVHRIAYSPSGTILASCSSDNTVRLWSPSRNFSRGDSVSLRGHGGPVRCVDFGSSSRSNSSSSNTDHGAADSLLLTASDDKTIKLWSLPKTNFVASFVGHTNWVRVAKFCQPPSSPNNDGGNGLTSLAASGGDDRTVRIWSCERAANLATYGYRAGKTAGNDMGGVRDLAFFPSGTSLAACGTDGLTRLFDLRSDAVIRTLDCNRDGSSAPTLACTTADCLSVHPDGIHLLCSTSDSARDGRVLLFDLRSPSNPLFEIPSVASIGKNGSIDGAGSRSTPPLRSASGRRRAGGGSIPTSAAFSLDGSRFAAALKDNATRIYRWSGGTVVMGEEESRRKEDIGRRNGKSSGRRGCGENPQKRIAKEVVTRDVARRHHDSSASKGDDCRPRKKSPPRYDDARDRCANAVASAALPSTSNSSSWKYDKDDLPEILSSTLDRMVGQLDILAQTVIMLERRLAIQESATEEETRRRRRGTTGVRGDGSDAVSGSSQETNTGTSASQQQESPPSEPRYRHRGTPRLSRDPGQESNSNTAPPLLPPARSPGTIEIDRDDVDAPPPTVDERVQCIMRRYSLLSPKEV